MNINQLVNYKHSLFTVAPVETKNLKMIKSKIFGGVNYVIDENNNLVVLISTYSIADASRELWHFLTDKIKPSENDIEMFNDDMNI